MKVEIAVTIITYNEEKNIARCIESVLPIADEIIVIDSYSTDKTLQIVKNYPQVKCVQHRFSGYISQKNYANSLTTKPVILSLDADECLDNELQKSILALKSNWQHDAYYCKRLNNYCGKWIKHGSWYPDKKLRLWLKEKGKWGGQELHETLILNNTATTAILKGHLLHYTIDTIEQHIAQINKFSSIWANSNYKAGKKANILAILFKPLSRFCIDYFIKGGYLDGYYGFVIAKNSAHAQFLKQSKLKALYKSK